MALQLCHFLPPLQSVAIAAKVIDAASVQERREAVCRLLWIDCANRTSQDWTGDHSPDFSCLPWSQQLYLCRSYPQPRATAVDWCTPMRFEFLWWSTQLHCARQPQVWGERPVSLQTAQTLLPASLPLQQGFLLSSLKSFTRLCCMNQ